MQGLTDEIDGLLERFGLASFRPGQREVIASVMAGRDVLCVMPTGGGKSLCYQLPALALPGVTVVVSPLIALMKDQEDQLRRLGVRVTALHSGLELAEQSERLAGIARGEFDLVYVAPERLRSQRFHDMLSATKIALLAVDEAHCISEWGHDFRPDYGRLGWFRQKLGMPPTIALTATATDVVRRDVALQLRLNDPAVFIRGFDRPNLYYGVTLVRRKADKMQRIAALLSKIEGSVIIYSASRKNCEETADFIRDQCDRRVAVYHAGLANDDRHRAQDAFMAGEVDVIVATNAFGMGVDKPDVRAVIHHTFPGTLEAYYQEAGRAGRDGKPAHCELLFSIGDRYLQEFFIDGEYPDRASVYKTLDFLRSQKTELIEMTRAEMREKLGTSLSEMGIGACLKLLEGAGAVERLNSRGNLAVVRIHENGPDLCDLLPTGATTQRKVLRFLEELVGNRRGQDCTFSPDRAAEALGVDRAAFGHAVRDLTRRLNMEYIPPFRGAATRVLDFETPAKDLPIDFEQLAERKNSEIEKLERVIRYAQSSRCRRAEILEYFGERAGQCGNCDRCASGYPNGGRPRGFREEDRAAFEPDDDSWPPKRADAISPSSEDEPPPAIAPRSGSGALDSVVRATLEAAAELNGRFGQQLIALTLTGSSSQKVTRFGLQKRRCFGKLSTFRQTEAVELIDAMLLVGLLQQGGDRLRPTVSITGTGLDVLHGKQPAPAHLPLPGGLQAKLGSPVHRPTPVQSRPSGPVPTPTPRPAPAPPSEAFVESKPAASVVGSSSNPSYFWTWRLLNAGFTALECQEARGLPLDTILQHAVMAAEHGLRFPMKALAGLPEPRYSAAIQQIRSLCDPLK